MFQLSAFRYACGEGCEWFADVTHFFGGVLMVLVALALTSLARRLLFLSHAGRESKVEQGISDHGVPGDAACASSRQQTIRLIGNRYVS